MGGVAEVANFYDVNAAISKPSVYDAMAQGRQMGQQQRALREQRADQKQLRSLSPKVQQGDPGAYMQAAAIDPQAASAQLSAGDMVTRRMEPLIRLLEEADARNPQEAQALWQSQGVPFVSQFAQGTQPTPDWQQAKPMLAQLKAKIEMAKSTQASADPTGFRELHMKAVAAGYRPGTPEYQNALRVALGTEGRASNAGFQTIEVENEQGGKDRYTFDPRRNVYTKFREDGMPTAQGGPRAPGEVPFSIAPALPQNVQDDPFASLTAAVPDLRITSRQRSPEENAKADGVPNSYHLTGRAIDIGSPSAQQQAQIMAWLQNDPVGRQHELIRNYADGHWHIEPRQGAAAPASATTRAGVGQTPAARKYAEETSQQQAQIDFLAERGRLEAENARLKAEAEAAAKLAAEANTQASKRTRDADRTLSLLDEAEKLIPESTGSGIGNVVDQGAALFGLSTKGAKAISSLQTIAGQLTSSMPRMEGPQSNNDVKLYQQMAGDLANPNLPDETRMAAARTLRALNNKYAGQQAQAPRGPRPGDVEDGYRFRGGDPSSPSSWEQVR